MVMVTQTGRKALCSLDLLDWLPIYSWLKRASKQAEWHGVLCIR